MSSLMKVVLSLSASGSLLFFMVLLITKLGRNRFNKAWQYYVWLLVALRLLLPITANTSLVGTFFTQPSNGTIPQTMPLHQMQYGVNTVLQNLENVAKQQTTGGIAPSSQEGWMDEGNWLWLIWALPAFLLITHKAIKYHRFVCCVCGEHTAVSNPDALNHLASVCDELGIHKSIDLYESQRVPCPLIIGFLRPRIVLPSISIPERELRYVLMHELTHFRRGDQLYKWLIQMVLCIHWFNPIVYWMVRKVNEACELACDEAVIRRLDAKAKHEYGTILINSLCRQSKREQAVLGSALHGNAITLRKRLEAIMLYKKKSNGIIILSLLLTAFLVVSGVLLGAFIPYNALAANPQAAEGRNLRVIQNEDCMTLEGKDVFSYSSGELYELWESGIWDIPEGESIEPLQEERNASGTARVGLLFPIDAGLSIATYADETKASKSIDGLPLAPVNETDYSVKTVYIRDTGIAGPFGIEVGMTTDTLLSLLEEATESKLSADKDGFDTMYTAYYQDQNGASYTIQAFSLLDMVSYCIITRD